MTGNLIFSIDGQAQPAQPLGSGSVTQTLNLMAGKHTVTVTYSGDTNYASDSGTVSFTIAPAITTTVLTLSTSIPNSQPQLALQATVTDTTANGLAGTVSFYNGVTLLSTATLNAKGVATYSSATVTYSSYSFTAVYNGNSNFAQSTSAAIQPAADFLLYTTNNNLAIAQGGVASISITVNPMFNLNGTVTAACSNLPIDAICRFQPESLSMSGSTAQVQNILIYTNTSPTLAKDRIPVLPGGDGRASAVLTCLLPGFFLLLSRRKALRKWTGLMLLFLAIAVVAGVSGCNAGGFPQANPTPAGNYPVTINFAGPNNLSHTMQISFTVNPN
jgi:hypothetical protein